MVDEEVYGVPEALPMTALLMMAVGMLWAYQSGVWGLWTMASYALADAVPVGTFVARWVIWALMGLAALTAVPAIYLAAYTTLSKFKVGLPAGLPGASRSLYIVGAVSAASAALIGGFLTAVCVVDPLEIQRLGGRGEFAPALTEYMRGLAGGAFDAYPDSMEWRFLHISKPWALYLFVASYCGVVAALSLSALAAGEGRLKRLPWRVGVVPGLDAGRSCASRVPADIQAPSRAGCRGGGLGGRLGDLQHRPSMADARLGRGKLARS